jgi:hypothetical protein
MLRQVFACVSQRIRGAQSSLPRYKNPGAIAANLFDHEYSDIPGADFNPKGPATRAEVASMLYRWLTAVE